MCSCISPNESLSYSFVTLSQLPYSTARKSHKLQIMKNKKYGTCALCSKKNMELRKSHFLPKALYRESREVTKDGTILDPIWLDTVLGTMIQTSRQATAYALCEVCEDILNQRGENIVIADGRRSGNFPLLAKLQGSHLTRSWELDESINGAAYYHFALGILWRASAIDWPAPWNGSRNSLGSRFEEQFRRYVHDPDNNAMPSRTYVNVVVNTDMGPCVGNHPPTRGRERKIAKAGSAHQFTMLGMHFHVTVGGVILPESQHYFRTDSLPVAFTTADFREYGLHEMISEAISKGKPKGKLGSHQSRQKSST